MLETFADIKINSEDKHQTITTLIQDWKINILLGPNDILSKYKRHFSHVLRVQMGQYADTLKCINKS